MIAAHNFFRGQHGADPLTWTGDLAQEAQGWANTCNWFHDVIHPPRHISPPINTRAATQCDILTTISRVLGRTSPAAPASPAGVLSSTCGDLSGRSTTGTRPVSRHTGHFTQVVWKNSRSVGCGWKKCGGGQDKAKGFYVVCKYDPTGNYQGQFRQNVGKQITGQLSDEWQPRGSNQVGTHNEENGSLERL